MVIIQAGLHHLHPRLNDAIDEIFRVLKPGGYFCFSEPHAGSLYDVVRKLWYKVDREIFAENEASVDLVDMKNSNRHRFDFEVEDYVGNIAYFLVLQSMVLRIPVAWKKYYAPALFTMESGFNRILGRRLTPLVSCRWRKKDR